MVLVFGSALLLVCALGVAGIVFFKHRSESRAAKERATEIDKGPPIQVARARTAKAERDLTLTGDVRALFQTSLYAKVSGYVREVRVDKGDFVKKDQILGKIESPETDQALVAAQSDYILRKSLAARAERLAPDIVSRQDLDTSNANLDVSRANLSRAASTQEYELIRAPFDGVVTARYVDPGALVPAATGATQSALPFVDVADPTTLRIDVYAGQDVASFVRDGDAVTIWQDIRPEQRIAATVTRRAGALDPRSRTMLIEVQMDNRTYGLVPGTFANVTLHIHAPPMPSVPAEALVSRGGKNMVARVEGSHVHFVEVEVGKSDGQTMQIERGIAEGDVVALNVPTEVNEGSAVQPSEKTESPKKLESKAPAEGDGG